jgi:hypothetical protein
MSNIALDSEQDAESVSKICSTSGQTVPTFDRTESVQQLQLLIRPRPSMFCLPLHDL